MCLVERLREDFGLSVLESIAIEDVAMGLLGYHSEGRMYLADVRLACNYGLQVVGNMTQTKAIYQSVLGKLEIREVLRELGY